ncbi:MAG TPA: MIP/aquaporin family protein [Rhizomicrobium sp.]|nr:MIP/aquaporin family protein [Rhizomicrobium sp.]
MKRELAAEALGTMLLVAGVVGSGIMAQRLTGDVALELLCNAIATGALLTVLILIFAPISGAHFNPAVTLAFALKRQIGAGKALLYASAQIAGGVLGTFAAHAMFAMKIVAVGATARSGTGLWFAEAVATAGLLLTIFGCSGRREVAAAVGLYITAAYWFTASTSFANPAVTIARAFTPSFAGIRPQDIAPFVAVQLATALVITPFAAWVFGPGAISGETPP